MAKRTAEQINKSEYAIMTALVTLNQRLPEDKRLGIIRMRHIRNTLETDFSERGLSTGLFAQIAELYPEDSVYDGVRTLLTSQDWLSNIVTQSGQDYDVRVNAGFTPHSILDPAITDNVVIRESTKPFVYTMDGTILSNVESGVNVNLYTIQGEDIGAYSKMPEIQGGGTPQQQATFGMNSIEDTEAPTLNHPVYVGWDGYSGAGDFVPGLKHAISAYLTSADLATASSLFGGDTNFKREDVEKSVEILKYLRSNGMDFRVGAQKQGSMNNQMDIELFDDGHTRIRVIDEDAKYIGRTYDSYNYYYYVNKGKGDAEPTLEDSLAILDYVSGRKPGQIVKARNTNNSQVRGVSSNPNTVLQVKAINHRFDSSTFVDEAEAEKYIRDSLADVDVFIREEIKAEQLVDMVRASIEGGYDYTEIIDQYDDIFSPYPDVRELQDAYAHDVELAFDLHRNGNLGDIDVAMLKAMDYGDVTDEMKADPEVFAQELFGLMLDERVGSYETGFNPNFIIDNVKQMDRPHTRKALMGALKKVNYDLDGLLGTEFAVRLIRDRLTSFDSETAVDINDVENPMLRNALDVVKDTLAEAGIVGENGVGDIKVSIDDKGVVQWSGARGLVVTRKVKSNERFQNISGEIGQILVPDEHGVIKTKFAGGVNYGMVPAYTGYFTFEDMDNPDVERMERFRVKGFEQEMHSKIRDVVRGQTLRPFMDKIGNIPDNFDSSAINGLYHGDVYGKRIPLNFVEDSHLSPEATDAILKTLSNRVRFDNQYGDYATTDAETKANAMAEMDRDHADEGAFSYWKVAGQTNMRVLDNDLENIADMTMTGTGKIQGLVWYLTDGATVYEDGSVGASAGLYDETGNKVADKTAVQKLDYFKYNDFNAWDRKQMAANQLMTAVHVDENVGTALMTFGGWNFDDSYAVSKEFAYRNLATLDHATNVSKDYMHECIEKWQEIPEQIDDLVMSIHALEDLYDDDTIPNEDVSAMEEGMHEEIAQLEAMQESGFGGYTAEQLNEASVLLHEVGQSAGIAGELTQEDFDNGLDYPEEYYEAVRTYDEYLDKHALTRPLVRGDKLSDFGGNKGTIGIVIDRHMTDEEAREQDLEQEVAIMRANPELDVVGAPYSMLSRDNAGVVKELMDGEVTDIVNPVTGEVYEGAMGRLNMIVTDLMVDKKTHAYTEEDVAEGKGRKASGQLAWALMAKDCENILTEIYGRNNGAWSTLREYLITTGLDMAPDGTLSRGYTPHADEERHVIDYDRDKTSAMFLNEIRDKGGFLNVPFPVKHINGVDCQTVEVEVLTKAERDVNKLERQIETVKNRIDANTDPEKLEKLNESLATRETDLETALEALDAERVAGVVRQTRQMWQVPILSASMRKDVDLVDGRVRLSDFSLNYARLYDKVGEYLNLEDKIEDFSCEGDKELDENYIKFNKELERVSREGLAAFETVQSTVKNRYLNGSNNGKHSFIRDKIMGKRMMNSATAVAIVDPRLKVGEVSMNSEMLAALDKKPGDTVMIWRDPVLRDGAIRAVKVVLDESVNGIGLPEVADKSHDGDFDGDTFGIIGLRTKAANRELEEAFSHYSNMLDLGAGADKENNFRLYFQSGMDLNSGSAKAESLGSTRHQELIKACKELAHEKEPQAWKKSLSALNGYRNEVIRKHGFGSDYVNLNNSEAMVNSFANMVKNGAKGSQSKFDELMDYFGIKYDKESFMADNVKITEVSNKPFKDIRDAQGIQYATGVKSDDTGLAGGFSQRLVSSMRDRALTAALELTYPVTQGALQIKHDPRMARVINECLTGPLNDIFNGRSQRGDKDNQMTKEQFVKELGNVFENVLGVDYNKEYLKDLSELLSDDKGKIQTLAENLEKKGSPLDRVAYGGGYNALNQLAFEKRSLLEGKNTKFFAPTKMREATPDTIIAKQDVHRRGVNNNINTVAGKAEVEAVNEALIAQARENQPQVEEINGLPFVTPEVTKPQIDLPTSGTKEVKVEKAEAVKIAETVPVVLEVDDSPEL